VSDGTSAWLSDAQLEYAVTTAVETEAVLPDPSTLSVGDEVRTERRRYIVTNLTQAQYVGTEGDLPFATGDRQLAWFADLLDMEGGFATLDGSDAAPLLFAGEYLTWKQMAPTGAREFERW
jgi:hypothetical protein